jgi:bacterioferritin-associated ferredoxin
MPVFVFVKDVEAILREGKQEIPVPEGAKISPAALDLIQERGLRVVRTGASEPLPGPAAAEPAAESPEPPPQEPEPTGQRGDAVSEEELEAIVDRVLARLRQVKGQPAPSAPEGPTPSDDDDMIICRCEEITKGEIKEAIRNGMSTLNGIKRVTRAGMGLCQGQTCQRLVSQILVGELGLPPAEVEPATARAPVRPVRLSVFATG